MSMSGELRVPQLSVITLPLVDTGTSGYMLFGGHKKRGLPTGYLGDISRSPGARSCSQNSTLVLACFWRDVTRLPIRTSYSSSACVAIVWRSEAVTLVAGVWMFPFCLGLGFWPKRVWPLARRMESRACVLEGRVCLGRGPTVSPPSHSINSGGEEA